MPHHLIFQAGDCIKVVYGSTFLVERVMTTDPSHGGDDMIFLGEGNNFGLGGHRDDSITGNYEHNVLVSLEVVKFCFHIMLQILNQASL